MKRFVSIGIIALIGFYSCNSKTNSSGSESLVPVEDSQLSSTVNSQQAKELLQRDDEIILLDVRTPEEFAIAHLKDAKNLDFQASDFRQRLDNLDPDKKYIVYCAIGGRSGKAVRLMEQIGFKHVYNAGDGFSELSKIGVPVAE